VIGRNTTKAGVGRLSTLNVETYHRRVRLLRGERTIWTGYPSSIMLLDTMCRRSLPLVSLASSMTAAIIMPASAQGSIPSSSSIQPHNLQEFNDSVKLLRT